MATGGYSIEVTGLDKLLKGLKGMSGYRKDLRTTNERIMRRAVVDVKRHAPMGHRSSKDSHSHKPPGTLKRRVYGKATYIRASVGVHDPGGYLILQEFGGTSFWHRGGAGAIRAVNRGHIALSVMVGGRRMANVSVGGKGHIVYHKARMPRGYFVWNEAYHLRQFIGSTYTHGLADIGKKYGLAVKVKSTNLDIPQAAPFGSGTAAKFVTGTNIPVVR